MRVSTLERDPGAPELEDASDHAAVDGDPTRARGVSASAIVTTIFALAGWIVGSSRLSDNSFLWHLRTGEYILDHGIPRHDVFSYTAPGTRWIAQSWLAEVIYAALARTVGLFGVRVFVGLIGVAVSVLALRLAVRLSGRLLRGAGIAAVSLGGVFMLWSERPLVIGVLFLVVLLWIVEVPESWVGRQALWTIPIVLWLWANVHGSFSFGLAYLALHVIGRWVDGAVPWHGRERTLVLATVIGVLVSLVNPYGLSLLTFPIELLSRGEILSHVHEWQSPDFRASWGIALGAWIAVFVWALARGNNRVTRRDLIVTVPMLLMALWAARNIAIAPLIGMPVIARAFAAEPTTGPRFSRAFVATACAAVALVGLAMGASAAAEPNYAFDTYPVKAMRYVARHDLLGRHLLTDDADAGFVINQYWPRQQVFMDDRFDMYPMQLMRDFLALAAGDPKWSGMLDHYDVDVVVWRSDEPLAALLNESTSWHRVHHDKTHAVWLRN